MTTRTLYFLAASDATPLAKHYALRNGALEKSSYPNIYHFDSHAESIRYLPDYTAPSPSTQRLATAC